MPARLARPPTMMTTTTLTVAALSLLACQSAPDAPPSTQPDDWRGAEEGFLENHVQLTSADQFLKAGEAYFSPDTTKIIFQAVAVPAEGEEPEQYYQMFVADLTRDARGRITGAESFTQLSPPGSSNTCGWFHPTKPNTVIFGSTLVEPEDPSIAGYQRGSSRYAWQFPKEMTIVECDLTKSDGTSATLSPLIADPKAYLAECSFTTDGRHLLYCEYIEAESPAGGDIHVKDLKTGKTVPLVTVSGYDGGPFFSPDEKWICYRSDRRGDNYLQLFLGKLRYGFDRGITGLQHELTLTDEPTNVNWCPFWHPSGNFIVYATSAVGHRNYEVFAIDTSEIVAGAESDASPVTQRITHAPRFDGLPVFNTDGSLMMWTSQRGEAGSSQIWLADFVLEPTMLANAEDDAPEPTARIYVNDEGTDYIYIYDPPTKTVSMYDMQTHEVVDVTDKETIRRVLQWIKEGRGYTR